MKIIAIEDLTSVGHKLTVDSAYRAVQIIEQSIIPTMSEMKDGMVVVRTAQGVASRAFAEFLELCITKHLEDRPLLKTDFAFQSIGFYPQTIEKIETLVRLEMERRRNFTGNTLLLILVTPPNFVLSLDKKDKFVLKSQGPLSSGPLGDSLTIDMDLKTIQPFIFQEMPPDHVLYRAA